jgi:hypothetical protein
MQMNQLQAGVKRPLTFVLGRANLKQRYNMAHNMVQLRARGKPFYVCFPTAP